MSNTYYTFWTAGLAVISAVIVLSALIIIRAVKNNADRIIRRLPSTQAYRERRVLDDPRLRNLPWPHFLSSSERSSFRSVREEKPAEANPKITALLASAAAQMPQETAVSDCCFDELGTRGVTWTINDGFFCRSCGMECYRLVFAGEGPGRRIPFGCLFCDDRDCMDDHKCICPRACQNTFCASGNDPARGESPGYEAPAGSRFA